MYKNRNEILPKIPALTLHRHYFRFLHMKTTGTDRPKNTKILVVVLYSGRNISDH